MPPRYAYWTILVDDQPTAFRASAQEDLLPTLKRLQVKHPSAKMMWWQNGKLWDRRVDAQDAMHTRGELGRRGDVRQGGGFRDRERKPFRERSDGGKRTAWTPRGEPSTSESPRDANNKLTWKPKGEFVPAPKRDDRERKPGFSRPQDLKTSRPSGKPEWKPKGSFDRERKPAFSGPQDRKTSRPQDPKTSRPPAKLEWKPKGDSAKRRWVPKEEYKKSQGIEAKRDKNWRPGGLHKDPKQKYKDAKKAKWTRFKKAIRTRWESTGKKKDE